MPDHYFFVKKLPLFVFASNQTRSLQTTQIHKTYSFMYSALAAIKVRLLPDFVCKNTIILAVSMEKLSVLNLMNYFSILGNSEPK